MRTHLQLLPAPRAVGATAIPSADLLALPARRGDHRAEVAQQALVIADYDELVADLRQELDERGEELSAWRTRALAAESAATRRPSRLAAWWAACCLLWWEATPARTPRWAWPSMLALLTLALAIVRW